MIKASVVGSIPNMLSSIAKENINKDKPTLEKIPI